MLSLRVLLSVVRLKLWLLSSPYTWSLLAFFPLRFILISRNRCFGKSNNYGCPPLSLDPKYDVSFVLQTCAGQMLLGCGAANLWVPCGCERNNAKRKLFKPILLLRVCKTIIRTYILQYVYLIHIVVYTIVKCIYNSLYFSQPPSPFLLF